MSGYRRGTNWVQGYTNVADFAGTFGVGIKDRAEIFGSFLVDTRIDRDVRPLFVANDPTFGSFIDRYPRVNQYWTGDNVGDFYVGAKFNLLSECQQNPAALALRGMIKLPTGDKDAGIGTGQDRFLARLHRQQGSGEAGGSVRASAATSGAGSPTASTFRAARSAGARASAFPSRNWLRVTGEVERLSCRRTTRRRSTAGADRAIDGSRSRRCLRTPRTSRARPSA